MNVADEAKSGVFQEEEFFTDFLQGVMQQLDAIAAAVWRESGGKLLRVAATGDDRVRFDPDGSLSWKYVELLRHAIRTREAIDVPPRTDVPEIGEAGNPTDLPLIMIPLCADAVMLGLVEVFLQPAADAIEQFDLLRIHCQTAIEGLVARARLDPPPPAGSATQEVVEFACGISGLRTLRETAEYAANESRRLLECDRVSVILQRRGRLEAVAISGQQTVERRATLVRRLVELAAVVLPTKESLNYPDDFDGLAPQIQVALDAHLEHSHMRQLTAVPLVWPEKTTTDPSAVPLGVLVLERARESSHGIAASDPQVATLARLTASSLGKAWEQERLFLLPVWRSLGRAQEFFLGRGLYKSVAAAAGAVVLLAGLALIPADFEAEAKGTLQPAARRDVFSEVDGQIDKVLIEHGSLVKKGDLLLLMRNVDLDVKIASLEGERTTTLERLSAVETSLLQKDEMSRAEQSRLHGERLAHRQTLESLERQIELSQQKRAQLEVKSPITGQVITWDIETTLLHRPARQGDLLLTVIDPDQDWQLEIRVPEDRMQHVAAAFAQAHGHLPVRYFLLHQPGATLAGTVTSIHGRAEARGEEGNTVLAHVEIDKSEISDLRPGAAVTARLACGRESLGYVWFHDALAFVQKNILFRWFGG